MMQEKMQLDENLSNIKNNLGILSVILSLYGDSFIL